MMKRTTLLFLALLASFGSFATITGVSTLCAGGAYSTFTDSLAPSGTWSSSNPAVATVTTTSIYTADVTGIMAGTAIISYATSSGTDTRVVTVNPMPAAIIGGGVTVCATGTLTLSDATPGGTWAVFGSPVATISSAGVLTAGAGLGVAGILYTAGGCAASTYVTVNAMAVDSIDGPNIVCVGSSITLGSVLGGGAWASSNPAVATVSIGAGGDGIVAGLSSGTTSITHTYTNSCGSFSSTRTVTVTSSSTAGTLSGPSSVVVGGTVLIYPTITGGGWSSSNPSVATVAASAAGVVTGISPGTATISYAVSVCSGTIAYATQVVTVNAFTGISGYVHYSGLSAARVYLIAYDPTALTLTAIDSVLVGGTADSAYYQFNGLPTDSFRVKAKWYGGGASYVPTYHTGSIYWSTATVIYHVSGTIDANKNINMIAGPTTSGPGFIGGSVITGANKGTTDGAAVPDMNVYLLNAATKAVMGYTTTDASGNYSFSNLPLGIYDIFPEELSYETTPYASVTLTTAAPSMSTAKFMQRTVSKKITPIGTVGISELAGAGTSLSAFPNPTSGKLNINWEAAASEAATLIITDITGREVLSKAFSMTKDNGAQVIDLSSLTNGMYFISVHSASISYINKIEVRH